LVGRGIAPILAMMTPQIIVFPGLGEKKESAYTLLRLPYSVIAVDYIATLRNESFSDYVRRLSITVEGLIDTTSEVYFVGVSFGSAVAQEMSTLIPARGVILISGYERSSEIASLFRFLGARVAPRLPLFAYNILVLFAPIAIGLTCRVPCRDILLLTRMYLHFPKRWFREHCRMAVSWNGKATNAPIYRIHGSRDPIIPYRDQQIDLVIKRGRHMLNLSHPSRVNRAIERFIATSVNPRTSSTS
jgi:pimeloyl-ACP methyl ester carboxylesterase